MPLFAPIVPPKDPAECPPWLYEAMRRLNSLANTTSANFGAISRGETPDGSGGALLDLSRYFYKPGIVGGQTAHGDVLAAGNLILSSTASATKGKIVLGTAAEAAFDEAQLFFGSGTGDPSARLHAYNYGAAAPGKTGSDTAVLLKIETDRSGQTANLTQWIREGVIKAGVTAAGNVFFGQSGPNGLELRSNDLGNSTTARITLNGSPNVIFDIPSGTVDPLTLALGLVSGTLTGRSLTVQLNATGGNSSRIAIDNTGGALSTVLFATKGVANQSGKHIDCQNSASTSFFSVGPTGAIAIAPTADVVPLSITGPSTPTQALANLTSSISGTTAFKINERAVLSAGRIGTGIRFTDDNATPANAKLLALDVSAIAAATTRTWTAQDASGTVPLLEANQSWLGKNTYGTSSAGLAGVIRIELQLSTGQSVSPFRVISGSGDGYLQILSDGCLRLGTNVAPNTGSQKLQLQCSSSQSVDLFNVTSSRTDASPLQLIIDRSGYLRGAIRSDSRVADSSDLTKLLALSIGNITTATTRAWGAQNLSGTIPIVGDDPPAVASGSLGKVDLTNQSADTIAATDISNTPPAGFYEVEVVLMCTTANVTSLADMEVVIGWTDNVGATTNIVIPTFGMGTTGRTTGRALVRVASGNITYAVNNNGGSAIATERYALYVRVIALG